MLDAQAWRSFEFSFLIFLAATLDLRLPNLTVIRMMKYSTRAKTMKIMLMNTQRISGQMPSDLGILSEMLLFMLINIRRSVRRRPSRPGTASKLTAKLIQLVRIIKKQGTK